jgi:hypothetical protein
MPLLISFHKYHSTRLLFRKLTTAVSIKYAALEATADLTSHNIEAAQTTLGLTAVSHNQCNHSASITSAESSLNNLFTTKSSVFCIADVAAFIHVSSNQTSNQLL